MGPRARAALEGAAVVAMLVFVASVAYLPHADTFNQPPLPGPQVARLAHAYHAWLVERESEDYPYPIHVDENVHWVSAANTQRAEGLRHTGIFSGYSDATPLSLNGLVHERGFHVALVMFQEMTGLPWLEIFRFLPAAWATLVAALVWAGLRPWAGALPAAALVALIPTSARFLGPGMLVPSAFGLAWMAAALLLLAPVLKSGRGGPLLLLVVVWAFFIHLVAGAAVLLVLLCALPAARSNWKGLATLAGIAALPALAMAEVFGSDLAVEVQVAGFLPPDFTAFDQLGIPVLLLWVAGCALLALFPSRDRPLVVGVAAAASCVVLAAIIANLTGTLELYALYDRWHQPFALFMAIPTAHALVTLAGGAASLAMAGAARLSAWRGRPRAPSVAGGRAVFVVVAVAAFVAATDTGLGHHINQPYYHVLDDNDWATFTWVEARSNATYEVFLADPWKAVVLAALTGKEPHSYLSPGFPPIHGEDYGEYLQGRSTDGAWLVDRDISLVVDRTLPRVPEFRDTSPMTAELEYELARLLADLRAGARD